MTMAEVREGIDALDARLVALLAERAAYIDRASDLKPALDWPARIDSRVEEVVANVRAHAAAEGLDPEFFAHLWRQIIDWSIAREEQVLGPSREP